MTVAELIAFLQTMPQDIPVIYQKYSEACLLEAKSIQLTNGAPARNDGWIQNERPDLPVLEYLCFPGN